jgi:methionyl aminopeptidase
MNNIIKTESEIKKMRISGKLASEVLEMIEAHVQPNISTEDINHICHNYIVQEKKAIAACLGYHGFPKSICTSVNDVVCHGIPSKKKKKY